MPIQLSGSLVITGSITTTGVITMSGSIASASYSSNSDLLQGTGSVGFTTTASFNAVSSSQQQVSASYIALSASYNTFSGSASTRITVDSASLLQVSASQQQISASLLNIIAIGATTGSNSFRADQSITGSLVVSSTITAQTLVVQTITSSIVYSSGSNNFGNQLNNIQTFTGSLNITGSITQTGANATASFASSVGIGTNTIINRLTLAGGSDGLTNMLGVYNNGINNLTAIGKGSAIILGGNTDGNYSAKIAMVYEGQNPSYLQPALTFHTMNNTFAYGSEVERMRITSTGNVGIGTCTPTGTYGKLSVAGGISILNDNNAKLQIGRYSNVSTDSYIVMASGSTGLTFTNANDIADVMRITTGGNVGIGTNCPSGTDITLNVRGTSTNTTSMVIAESYDAGSMVSLYSGASSGDDPSLIYLKALRFGSGNKSTAGYVERMRITCGGVVKVKNTTIPEGDDIGLIQVENTTAAAGSGANVGITVKSYNGTSQIMQWENRGIRLGNRIKTNTGEGAVYFTYGNDTIGMTLTSEGHITKPCSAAFHAAICASTCGGLGGRIIQFNCVLYNAGGGYNGTTSTFTAPISGLYQFNFTFLNQNVQNVDGGHAYLSTNYGVATYYFTRYGCLSGGDRTGYGNYVPMHGAIAVYLPTGCKACVGAFWDGDGAFTHNSAAWSNFTGYLVG